MAHPHKAQHDRNKDARVHKIVGKMSDKTQDEHLIRKAMSEHDRQQHAGKHTKLKFANGGAIPGRAAGGRLDKPSRHHKGKGNKKGTTVNVVVAGHPPAPPMPAMPPAGMNVAPPPMARPPMPAGPVMPPPGMPMRKSGGRVKYTGGAADGVGRLEKVENYGKKARQIAPENR